jgi:glutaredoxin 3
VDHSGAVYYDVKAESARMDEMLQHSNGERKVPVIVDGGKVTVGYGGS